MRIQPAPEAKNITENAILITGSTRTGSTMMGRLFHSLAGVEYYYEPPFCYALFPLIETLDEATWRYFYESYLFEDLMVGAISGRHLNLNRHDDSSVWSAKPAEEIQARLDTGFRRADILRQVETRRLAYKTVDITAYIPRFRSYYPKAPVIIMTRKPGSVVASVLQKGWNADHELRSPPRVFPIKKVGDLTVPHWVPDAQLDAYVRMSELERCCLYYIVLYEGVLERPDYTFLDYDRFVSDPKGIFDRLIAGLGLEYGSLTARLLEEVNEPSKDRNVDFGSVDPSLYRRMMEVAEKSQALQNV